MCCARVPIVAPAAHHATRRNTGCHVRTCGQQWQWRRCFHPYVRSLKPDANSARKPRRGDTPLPATVHACERRGGFSDADGGHNDEDLPAVVDDTFTGEYSACASSVARHDAWTRTRTQSRTTTAALAQCHQPRNAGAIGSCRPGDNYRSRIVPVGIHVSSRAGHCEHLSGAERRPQPGFEHLGFPFLVAERDFFSRAPSDLQPPAHSAPRFPALHTRPGQALSAHVPGCSVSIVGFIHTD
jgi:hypothetical protein